VVRFENVGLRYSLGPEVLRDVSFQLAPRSFQFLTGPSGAGKSSLLRMLFLALKPTRGLINLFGHDVAMLSPDALATLRRRIGVVFQDFPPARPPDDLRERRAAAARASDAKRQAIATRWSNC
jgi:cell division transport system ATP-binding protein